MKGATRLPGALEITYVEFGSAKKYPSQYYRCFIECYMNHCTLIYGNAYHTHIDCIEVAQRKSLGIIDNQAPFTHSNPIFHDLKVLKFSDIYRYNLGIYMYLFYYFFTFFKF